MLGRRNEVIGSLPLTRQRKKESGVKREDVTRAGDEGNGYRRGGER